MNIITFHSSSTPLLCMSWSDSSTCKAVANCCSIPLPRILQASLQPTTSSLPSAFQSRVNKISRRVCFFYDRPTFRHCCRSRICTTNASFPLEKIAYRQIGDTIATLLRKRIPTVDICEYTNEIDLADSSILPSCEIMVILTHDWPTVHEDPVWAAAWPATRSATGPTVWQTTWPTT